MDGPNGVEAGGLPEPPTRVRGAAGRRARRHAMRRCFFRPLADAETARPARSGVGIPSLPRELGQLRVERL